MSGFNMARVDVFAKREGISFREACRRINRIGARRRRQRQRVSACVQETPPPKVRLWWEDRD